MPYARRVAAKRRINGRKDKAEPLSVAVLDRLVTGYWWSFEADGKETEPGERELRRLWRERKAEIEAWREKTLPHRPAWASFAFSRGKARADWWNYGPGDDVRPLWLDGQWAYCIGRPAKEHPRYQEARARFIETHGGGWTWLRTWSDVDAVLAGCTFDLRAAWRPVLFAERFCKHSIGEFAAQPFRLLDWQQWDVIMPLFGWMRPDGTRRYRRAHIEVPKKQGKSTLSAFVGIYLLVGDLEPGPEVYAAAVDRFQAGRVFDESAEMVKRSPELRAALNLTPYKKELTHPANRGLFRALSADAESAEGLNIHGCVVDELHAHKNRRLWGALTFGGAARRQPLFTVITTAGVYDPVSIGWEQHDTAQKILTGTNPSWHFFAYLASADRQPCEVHEGDPEPEAPDWRDEAVHLRANPSYGVTVNAKTFAEEVVQLEGMPSAILEFRRYRLNQWTQTIRAFIDMAAWSACVEPVSEEALHGRPCYGGLDLSQKDDLSSWSLVFPPWRDDLFWRVVVRNWVPEETIPERVRSRTWPYDVWVRDGWLCATPGFTVDQDFIREQINRDADAFDIREIGYDPWNATEIARKLQDSDGLTLVEVRQGARSLSEPTNKLSQLAREGLLAHGANPILTWAAGNLVVRYDANQNVAPDKEKASGKIDPIVATIIAMNRALAHASHAPKRSRYEDHKLVVVSLGGKGTND